MDLKLDQKKDIGLYLIFADGSEIALTKTLITKCANDFLSDPEKVPQNVKAAAHYGRCAICPMSHEEGPCHAIYPTFPFRDILDKYTSFDNVIAIYKDSKKQSFQINHTTMQNALLYIVNISLFQYCEVGSRYANYYKNISPLDDFKVIVNKIFLNAYFEHGGNTQEIENIIMTINSDITVTTHCQLNKLRLINNKDALINAFVKGQTITEYLKMQVSNHFAQQCEDAAQL